MNVENLPVYVPTAVTTPRAVLFVCARWARFYWQTNAHVLVHLSTLASVQFSIKTENLKIFCLIMNLEIKPN